MGSKVISRAQVDWRLLLYAFLLSGLASALFMAKIESSALRNVLWYLMPGMALAFAFLERFVGSVEGLGFFPLFGLGFVIDVMCYYLLLRLVWWVRDGVLKPT